MSNIPPLLGQQIMADSEPIVIASDQSAVPVTGTFFQATQPVSGTVAVSNFPATQPVSGPLTDAELRATPVPVSGSFTPSGTQNVDVTGNTIGLSTSALQTTGNASLASIDTKLTSPLTVQATDLDVRNLSQNQDSVLIYGSDDGGTTKRVIKTDSGGAIQVDLEVANVTVNNGAGASAVNIQDGGNSITVDGTVAVSNFPVSQAVTGTVSVSNFPATQPISAASLPLPTGAATETTLSALNTKVPSNLTVTATRLLVDGSGVTQPVSATTLPLPTGASTSALQTTGNTSLSSIDTKTPALGQGLMAASTPVVIASNQSNVPTTIATALPAGTNNIGDVDIASALPAGTNTIGNVNQSLATAGFGRVTDGTNTAAVKAASIAPLATDPALVVSISPNSVGGSSNITQFGGNAVVTGTGTSGLGIPRVTVSNDSAVRITDGTSTQAVKAASTVPLAADPASVVTLSPNMSTVATSIAKAEDAAHTTGDVGVMSLAVRSDTLASPTSASGDYSSIAVDNAGRQVVTHIAPRGSLIHAHVNLTTTTETTLIAASAGFFNDIVNVVVSNNGAGNEIITFRSGTAGTILFQIATLANSSGSVSFNVPIPATAVNLPITVQMNVAAATGVGVSVTCVRNI